MQRAWVCRTRKSEQKLLMQTLSKIIDTINGARKVTSEIISLHTHICDAGDILGEKILCSKSTVYSILG